MQLIASLGGLIVWYVGGRDRARREDDALGSLTAFLAYLAMFYTPLATLVAVHHLAHQLPHRLPAGVRAGQLDTPVESTDPPNRSTADVKGRIEFDKVTFGYERHRSRCCGTSFRGSNRARRSASSARAERQDDAGELALPVLRRQRRPRHGRRRRRAATCRQPTSPASRRRREEPFMFRGTIWDNLDLRLADQHGRASDRRGEGGPVARVHPQLAAGV